MIPLLWSRYWKNYRRKMSLYRSTIERIINSWPKVWAVVFGTGVVSEVIGRVSWHQLKRDLLLNSLFATLMAIAAHSKFGQPKGP